MPNSSEHAECGIDGSAPQDMLELMQSAESDSELNPLLLLGLEPWVIRTLEIRELGRFLRSYKKLMAKHFHPDRNHDPLKEQAINWYFRSLMAAMDRLASDDFYLRMWHDRLVGSSVFEQMRKRILKLSAELHACGQELAAVKRRLAES